MDCRIAIAFGAAPALFALAGKATTDRRWKMANQNTQGHGGGQGGGNPGQGGAGNSGNDQITLEVATPNGVFRGTFEKTAKIEEVIAAIIADRHLAAGDSFELHSGDITLQPVQRTLVSFGLHGTVKLDGVTGLR
jgi:hypothetical protein